MEKLTISVDEVGAALGVSRPTAYRIVVSDGFPSVRVGKRIIISKAAFIDWLDGKTKTSLSAQIGGSQKNE